MTSRRVIDLSHPLDERVPMFPGLAAPRIEEHLSREASRSHYAGGTTFVIHHYAFAGNSGTYMDAPFHRYEDGDDLATLSLVRTVDLPGVVVDLRQPVAAGKRRFGVEILPSGDLSGRAVLFLTGWSARWGGASYLDPNPFISAEAASMLVERGVALVGIDSWNIDDTHDGTRPAHSLLLRAGIPIVENLRGVEELPSGEFRFFAAPLPIRGGSAVPVRAFALV